MLIFKYLLFLIMSLTGFISAAQKVNCTGCWGKRIDSLGFRTCKSMRVCGKLPFELLRIRNDIETIVYGDVKSLFTSNVNHTQEFIQVKQLFIGTGHYFWSKKLRLGGVRNLVSYFEAERIFFPVLYDLKYKDTLDLGSARTVFIRAFQLPAVSKMHVVRHHRLDTIRTNAMADSFITFHNRKVFLMCDTIYRRPDRIRKRH